MFQKKDSLDYFLEKNNLKLKIIIGNITTKSYSFKIFNSYDRCT